MRGKTKIGKSLLMLSLIVMSILAFAIAPAFATVTTLSAPDVLNPFLDVGDLVNVDILVDDVTDLWSFEFTLSYDTSVLTATGFSANLGLGFTDPLPSGINDGAGFMFMGATMGIEAATGEDVGTGDGKTIVFHLANTPVMASSDKVYVDGVLTTDYTIDYTTGEIIFAKAPKRRKVITADYEYKSGLSTDFSLPIATVSFTVDARGTSALGLSGSALTGSFGNLITHNTVAGSFDNSMDGVLSVPTILDNTFAPGQQLTVEVSIAEVENLWGFQFVLQYNEDVFTALRAEALSIFLGSGFDDAGPGYVALAYSSFSGDLDGLTTVGPVAIAKIVFRVDALGGSMLDLEDTVLVDVFGDALVHESEDGLFNNAVDLAGRKAWAERKRMTMGNTYKLYAKVENLIAEPVVAKATFTMTDLRTGVELGTLETDMQTIPGSSTVILETDFDTTLWGTAPYKVDIKAQCGGTKTFSVSVRP